MIKLSKLPMFFLGALSKDGFSSDFANSYDVYSGWRAYILKGGPGTGKSTVMKSIAAQAAKGGEQVLLCPCSSDPNSLDAVILPQRKITVLDGTAPHVVEPQFPIVCEQIINLGEAADSKALQKSRAQILTLCEEKSAYMARAKRYTAAAAELLGDAYKTQWLCTDIQKVERTAIRLAKEYITAQKSKKGERLACRLRAVTPLGLMYHKNTPQTLCQNTIVIADEYGAAANRLLSVIEEKALQSGCRVITALDPIFPDKRIDAVMLPELKIAFCCENRYMHPATENRRIHSRRFTNAKELQQHKPRLSFDKKTADDMLREAAVSMAAAGKAHNAIEQYYVNVMNFEYIADLSQRLIANIFQK